MTFFKMKGEEPIKEMYEMITKIIGGLKALGKEFPNAQLVKKILYSLLDHGNLSLQV